MQVTEKMLKQGDRYEDRYGGWLQFFWQVGERVSQHGAHVTVIGPPWSWVPLLKYIGAHVLNPIFWFDEDDYVHAIVHKQVYSVPQLPRSLIEVLCAFRPETVDALWKVDRQWGYQPKGELAPRKEFVVTCNGSFDCQEIKQYEKVLASYAPSKKNVVLVPCAADKPYPARIHKAVLALMPEGFYLANITGVLGIVPMDLWSVMPHYDSGIPNEWRCMTIVRDYFRRFEHNKVVVYCDFYNLALDAAFKLAGYYHGEVDFVNEVRFYADYLDLLEPVHLARLKDAFKGV